MRAPFRVALIGLGNVGGALARRLVEDADRITLAAGRPIALEGIAVAHPEGRRALAPLRPAVQLLAQPQLDAIVEVMGGIEPASTYISTALQAGRQVITANKQLVAAQGPPLACLGPLRFEASVASAIPIVETLADALGADRIGSIMGIHDGARIEADIRPRLVPADAPMARVHGAMNAIALDAEYAGSLIFEGPGAGPDAAASAVLADLIRAAKGVPASAGSLLATLADTSPVTVVPLGPTAPYPAA